MSEDLRSQLAGTPYELVRELGRGGMGVVIEARDRSSGASCAVKLMLEGPTAASDLVDRMRLEAETLEKGAAARTSSLTEVPARPPTGLHFTRWRCSSAGR